MTYDITRLVEFVLKKYSDYYHPMYKSDVHKKVNELIRLEDHEAKDIDRKTIYSAIEKLKNGPKETKIVDCENKRKIYFDNWEKLNDFIILFSKLDPENKQGALDLFKDEISEYQYKNFQNIINENFNKSGDIYKSKSRILRENQNKITDIIKERKCARITDFNGDTKNIIPREVLLNSDGNICVKGITFNDQRTRGKVMAIDFSNIREVDEVSFFDIEAICDNVCRNVNPEDKKEIKEYYSKMNFLSTDNLFTADSIEDILKNEDLKIYVEDEVMYYSYSTDELDFDLFFDFMNEKLGEFKKNDKLLNKIKKVFYSSLFLQNNKGDNCWEDKKSIAEDLNDLAKITEYDIVYYSILKKLYVDGDKYECAKAIEVDKLIKRPKQYVSDYDEFDTLASVTCAKRRIDWALFLVHQNTHFLCYKGCDKKIFKKLILLVEENCEFNSYLMTILKSALEKAGIVVLKNSQADNLEEIKKMYFKYFDIE